jgi:hypothetical protein
VGDLGKQQAQIDAIRKQVEIARVKGDGSLLLSLMNQKEELKAKLKKSPSLPR